MSDIFGEIAGGLFGLAGQQVNQQWSAKQAERQMSFQNSQRETAHQAEVIDLRKAGLNPILSATGGKGATAMPGAQPDAGQDPATAATNAASAVAAMRQTNAQTKKTEAEASQEDVKAKVFKKLLEYFDKGAAGIDALTSGSAAALSRVVPDAQAAVKAAIGSITEDIPSVRSDPKKPSSPSLEGFISDLLERSLPVTAGRPMPPAISPKHPLDPFEPKWSLDFSARAAAQKKMIEQGLTTSAREKGGNWRARPLRRSQ